MWSNTFVLAYCWEEWLLRAIHLTVKKSTKKRAKLNPRISREISLKINEMETMNRLLTLAAGKLFRLNCVLNAQLEEDMQIIITSFTVDQSTDFSKFSIVAILWNTSCSANRL